MSAHLIGDTVSVVRYSQCSAVGSGIVSVWRVAAQTTWMINLHCLRLQKIRRHEKFNKDEQRIID